MDSAEQRVRVTRWQANQPAAETTDALAVEEPLEIRVAGRAVSVTMRTPGHDEELSAGFLLSEGLIARRQDVVRIAPCPRAGEGNVVDVTLSPEVSVDFARLTRHVFASSSCGVCGKATIDSVRGCFPPVDSPASVASDVLLSMPPTLRRSQATFSRTGGLHAAAIFDLSGRLRVLREDVGRHNAVDKVIGRCLLDGLDLTGGVLLVSGRSSFEIMQKSLAARVPIVAAISAPSSLAVQFAEESGLTLVGFLREDRFNVYSHARRVRFV
jgi:FdhD protein